MNARVLVRSLRMAVTPHGWRLAGSSWRRRRLDAAQLPRVRAERARVPGVAVGAEALPGGGVIHFARSSLRVRVASGGAVFCGWDGAAPEPSYALAGQCPPPDPRAGLEPDKDGGWRVVSERVMVTVSRRGMVEVRTPGGVVLRRDLPPRWWGPDGGPAVTHWSHRSRVAADARFFGLGGRSVGPRLPSGSYRLWNSDPGPSDPVRDPLHLTMPLQLVVADVGTHLVFHDNSWDGRVTLRTGTEGAGSGPDQPGRSEVRMTGGPLRYWVLTGAPARVMHGWSALTGAPAMPPDWALGPQHVIEGSTSEEVVRVLVARCRQRSLPLRAVHLEVGPPREQRGFAVDRGRFPDLPALATELDAAGVRLVCAVDPGVKDEPGNAVLESGRAAAAFVGDALGRTVRGVAPPGSVVFPDFTDPRVREWWSGLYAERLPRGFAAVWHSRNEPTSYAAFGERTLPRSARHCLEGRGGDHREAHNVYGLTMAAAGHQGLLERRPDVRPFVFTRAGWAGVQRYGGACSGPGAADWSGLRAALARVLGLGLSGVPYSGTDVGGGAEAPTPELYLRWVQLAAYLPLFRSRSPSPRSSRSRGTEGLGSGAPWEHDPEVLAAVRDALDRREELAPYFGTLAWLAHRTGAPYVRPLWWQHPRDRALRECDDAFLLGDALLIAPVLEHGTVRRMVRLPRGRWYDTASGRAYEGPARVLLDAPAERIPVLARAGAAIPVGGPEGRTELEVWSPAPGRTGGGLVITGTAEGRERARVERLTVLATRAGEPRVTREDGAPVDYPVRVRG
ncbi:glycoside hydrolase family 31 protein [Streptomyces oceani]|uniref:Glycosyl hydrolase n=1 Tax=Streptomyces oceani TaxID=1075402 RepID=A0A1E7JXP4_9ACTN|nr:glycoside hydrolase family 31 protein [Streptomyces oceani]OEU96445.1 glycosyl hydrolase [Streptomyces oceani]